MILEELSLQARKAFKMSRLRHVLICMAALAGIAPGLSAQAPPGPLQPANPQPPSASAPAPAEKVAAPIVRKNILGAWRINRDESDDPRKKMEQGRGSPSGSPRVGVGWPGGGMGGGGYGGRRGSSNENDEQRERMGELLSPARTVTLAQKTPTDPEIDLSDDRQRKFAFFTDGRKLEKSKDENNQQIAAHWDGTRLVTEEKGPRGGKLSRTYELSADGTQLTESIHFTSGRNNTPVTIRYVYDAVDASKAE
jgi:hypothetical protein